MGTKLFVGNLSHSTTEEDLTSLFAGVGAVVSVEMITDQPSGASKGFAFIEMSGVDEAQKAVETFNGSTLDRRSIKVALARRREERPAGGGWYTDSPAQPKPRTRRPGLRHAK